MKAIMKCANHHTTEAEIKTFKGRRYWLCVVCNMVTGLPDYYENLSFTGYGDPKWCRELQTKLKGGNQDD